ncbi:hypothetical protein PVAR5_2990 [Paecilomyces variotii No. 5]|uniref:Uncharacterized protein n=1 Tax=Byssochlamys spectabilis (strain No. 5 / NBRC 109023) TaxID=1356009 RepID=V5HX04_BYSSN|nr:hypothetical protein PVAR5_2990 [Paecilomyces variotii No. 5]
MRRLREAHGDRNDKEEPVCNPLEWTCRLDRLAVAWASNHRRDACRTGRKRVTEGDKGIVAIEKASFAFDGEDEDRGRRVERRRIEDRQFEYAGERTECFTLIPEAAAIGKPLQGRRSDVVIIPGIYLLLAGSFGMRALLAMPLLEPPTSFDGYQPASTCCCCSSVTAATLLIEQLLRYHHGQPTVAALFLAYTITNRWYTKGDAAHSALGDSQSATRRASESDRLVRQLLFLYMPLQEFPALTFLLFGLPHDGAAHVSPVSSDPWIRSPAWGQADLIALLQQPSINHTALLIPPHSWSSCPRLSRFTVRAGVMPDTLETREPRRADDR